MVDVSIDMQGYRRGDRHPPRLGVDNPKPEVVLAVNGQRKIVGAALGNDVNLRDFEGRRALLLSNPIGVSRLIEENQKVYDLTLQYCRQKMTAMPAKGLPE